MRFHQWIHSICFIIISISSIAFVYCQWQNVKAQRAQAVAISCFYNNSSKILLETLAINEGLGKALDELYSINTRELYSKVQK